MPYSILKRLDPAILGFFSTFFNHLISNAYFPRHWRHANITAIPKSGKDISIIGNWRPISQLTCISKIFERIIANRLAEFEGNETIFPDQFGFLHEHSAEHALAKLQADIINGINAGKFTSIVALDLRSAFDTICHNLLIHRMAALGINEMLVRTIQSMLTDRTFSVHLDGASSTVRRVVAGVPQGSVLAPICFNYFMVGIPDHPRCKKIQFADDTTIYRTHNDATAARGDLNHYLDRLREFFNESKLLLNEKKTELQHVLGLARETRNRTLRRNTKRMTISVGGHVLPAKTSTRVLGLHLQTNGRFIRHLDLRLEKLRRAKFLLGGILRNRRIKPRIKTNIYKMYLRPLLTYASPVWCRQPCLSSHQIERMRQFERSCLRSTANIQRERGDFKHVNASHIYRISKCPRIDRHIAQRHIRFYERIKGSGRTKFTNITAHRATGQYPPIDHFLKLSEENRLYDRENKLQIFHQRYNGSTDAVYNISQ